MIEDGSWSLKSILSRAKFRVGVSTFPAGPVQKATLTTTDGFGIYAGTKYPEAAWELVKFLVGKEYGRAMARANLLQPARASLVDEWAELVASQFPDQAKEFTPATFADGQRNGYSVVAETFPNQDAVQRVVSQAWDKIFLLGQAPVSLMDTVSRQIDSIQS